MIVINLGASIFLAKYIGITGIFVGTLLSRLLTVGIFDPYIVFKKGLKQPLRNYYKLHGIYHMVTIISGLITLMIFNNWIVYSIGGWIIKGICVFLMLNILYCLVFFKYSIFKELVERLKAILRKIAYE